MAKLRRTSWDPTGIIFHPATGNLLVGDALNKDIREFDGQTGAFIGVFGQSSGNLNIPQTLLINPVNGNLMVSDEDVGIKEFDINTGNLVGIFGQTGTGVTNPGDIVFHPTSNNLFVGDVAENDVRQFDINTGNSLGVFGQTSTDLTMPRGLAFHPSSGNLFANDAGGNEVRQFNGSDGTFLGVFGQTSQNLGTPIGMAFHPFSGNLLIGDDTAGNVKEFDGVTGAFLGVFGDTAANVGGVDHLLFRPDNQGPVALPDGLFRSPNAVRVVAPYWQADSNSYTFIAVSHPSLTGMNSQIGVSINAVLNDVSGLYGPPAEFTVHSDSTQKVFIAAFNNTAVNPFTQQNGVFITGSTSASNGLLIANPVATNPGKQPGVMGLPGRGYPDITQLDFWGAIVVQSTVTGFAMEFIGDNQDSRAFNTPYFSGIN